jgi:hypothetical protein
MLFKEIIGQQEIKDRLLQLAKEERVGHACCLPEGRVRASWLWQLLLPGILIVKTAAGTIRAMSAAHAGSTQNWFIPTCILFSLSPRQKVPARTR